VKALEDLCTYLRTDIDSIRKQIANQDKQVEIASRESEGLQILAKKGLANVYRTLSVERNVAQLEGERLKVVNSLSRAQQELSKNELALIALRNKRQNDLTTELSQTQAKIDALAQKYDMNERLLIEAELGVARQKSGPGKPGLSASYSIVRQAPTGPVSIDATEATPVEPGDTVKVTLPFPALTSGGRQLGRSSLPATVFPSTELGNAAVLPRSTTTE
jgi:polysaccharide export outer membrane protein/exopolysaccharide production protein ExoF